MIEREWQGDNVNRTGSTCMLGISTERDFLETRGVVVKR